MLSNTIPSQPTSILNTLLSTSQNCDELKLQLDKYNTTKKYINYKENDDLLLIFYDNVFSDISEFDKLDSNTKQFINEIRSCIIDKNTLQIVCTQFNKVVYNDDAIALIKNEPWENICIQKCYEGTLMVVFNHNDIWYTTTRRCLDSNESFWVPNCSYKSLFDECISDKLDFNTLNTSFCYYFILVHHKNKSLISYDYLGQNYTKLIHVLTIDKTSQNEVSCSLDVDNIKKSEILQFNNLNDVLTSLKEINSQNMYNNTLTTEGYIITIKHNNSITYFGKLQTTIYEQLSKIRPNVSNINQAYLELYKQDKLSEYIKYQTKFGKDVINRIHLAFRTMSREILNIYHATRKKKNSAIYNILQDQYKKVLYDLHGLYINNRKNDLKHNKIASDFESNSININDIYYYLKELPFHQIKKLFYERMQMYNSNNNPLLSKDCCFTAMHCKLMFLDD
jgi:hypothetical protein